MKVLQILILVFLFNSFTLVVKAQADCSLSLWLKVLDSQGKTLDNARVKFKGKVINYDSSRGYYFEILGGCGSIKELLEVTTPGFDKFEKEVEVKNIMSGYELTLKSKNTNEVVSFNELAVLSGYVKDVNEGVIPNTKVILTNKNGKRFETIANKDGYFSLDVQSGDYSLEFIGTAGFAPKRIEKIKLEKNDNRLNIILDVKSCDDPTINCDSITSDPKTN